MPSIRKKVEIHGSRILHPDPQPAKTSIGDFIFNDEVKKTLIKKNLAEEMNFLPHPYVSHMLKHPVRVGSKKIEPMGTSDLDFKLDGCSVYDKAHYVKDDEINADVIVGKDIMDEYGIEITKDENGEYKLDLEECRRITAEPEKYYIL